jgi:bifunctional non-homologous end joining protein LigD
MPERLKPMLARPGELPSDDGWAFEVKWDGVRAIAYWDGAKLRLASRDLNQIGPRYPELEGIGGQLGAHTAILDGEIVAFDAQGRPSFQRLQGRMHLGSGRAIERLAREAPVTYMVFDLLHLDGRSTMASPYASRRELLEGLGLDGPAWRTPRRHEGDGQRFLEVTAEHGLEGVVAKRLDSTYRPGERSGSWLKIKNWGRQELVIGGWLPGRGNRAGRLGALLLGYYEQRGARRVLRFAGRVGTGFDEAELERLGKRLHKLASDDSPFEGGGVRPPREARFVQPRLVAEVEFSGWTKDGVVRQSSYKGLREDRRATEVEMETVPSDGEIATARPARRPARRRGGGTPYTVVHQTKRHLDIEVGGRSLRLSNREKVLYPKAGFTKGELIDYYANVAPVLLPHLKGRPLTLKRYPDGVEGEHFYEKRCPAHRPDWVTTVPIWSERGGEEIPYCVVEDLATLVWAANLADIELHTSLSSARTIARPTMLVFDLDPGPGVGLKECCGVALRIRDLFDAFRLETLVKTSGSKGLQVYLPLNTATSYEQTKPFARAVAELLEKQRPKLVVSRMAKSLRPGRVLIDWSQNDEHKTTVCVYSLRATPEPMVSTPLTWEEVERGSRKRSAFQLSAGPEEALERVERDGDLFAPLLELEQRLPDL